MQTYRPSPWINLHVYFKLGLLGSNSLMLTLVLGMATFILFYTASFSPIIKQSVTLVGYTLILLLVCNQYICIYVDYSNAKKGSPAFRQVFFNPNFGLIFLFAICCFALLYPFYYFENDHYIITIYNLFFVLFVPAIIGCLLGEKSLIPVLNPLNLLSFMGKNLSGYLFCMITVILMGLGYKTLSYYSTIWFTNELALLFKVELGAYLFLVSAYLLADLFNQTNTFCTPDPDEQDLTYLKNYISTGEYDHIHDFFKLNLLHSRSINLLDFYLKFLFTIQDEKRIQLFGNRWINQLFLQNNIKKAVSVFELVFKKNPHFNLSEPLINFTLAKHFLLTKQYQIVVHLLKNLAEKCPDFVHLPEALLILAKAYIALNLEIKAKQAINIITQNFSTSDYYAEALAIKKILQHTNSSDHQPPAI